MQDSLILSTFVDTSGQAYPRDDRRDGHQSKGRLFHAVRAVICMEVLVAVATLFDPASGTLWLRAFAQASAGVIPATLLWFALASATLPLMPCQPIIRLIMCAVLGASCGSFGVAMALSAGLPCSHPWLGGLWGGALLAVLFASGPAGASFAVSVPALDSADEDRITTRRPRPQQLQALQSGIRVHFLNNTLNSAIALLHSEPDRAAALLEDLGDLLQHALRDPGLAVTLQDELELTERYLAIERVRFGQRLQVNWMLDPLAGDAQIPPLLLQPLVENAVRHGVEPSPGGARIDIRTEHLGDLVLIEVVNTLPAGPGSGGRGLGLRNIWHRLKLLHDDRCHVSIQRRGAVFRVRLEIPT